MRDIPRMMGRNPGLIQNLTLGLCAGVLASGCVSGYGKARLTQTDDRACFAVENTPANRSNPPLLRMLAVYDMEPKPPKEVWRFSVAGGARPLMSPDTCIQYGRLPSGAEVATPAAKLDFGKYYEVDISASAENSTSRSSFYNVKFCLIKDASGATKVHEIQWDKTQERWRYDVCKQR
jgi:hypothetical protein